jgi:hypothetical protein
MSKSPVEVVRACMQAYVDKDRAAIEDNIAADYRFTSPLDNRLDRATYFERCWPNSRAMKSCKFVHQVEQGERAFVVYEAGTTAGKSFRNCEIHTVRAGKLVETEVYFGWDLPHKASRGGYIDADTAGES